MGYRLHAASDHAHTSAAIALLIPNKVTIDHLALTRSFHATYHSQCTVLYAAVPQDQSLFLARAHVNIDAHVLRRSWSRP